MFPFAVYSASGRLGVGSFRVHGIKSVGEKMALVFHTLLQTDERSTDVGKTPASTAVLVNLATAF